METVDFESFRARMSAMARLFGFELDAPMLDLYWLALRDWSIDEFQEAAGHLLTVSTFMPKPADFSKLRKAGAMTAGEAFAKARQIARSKWQSELISYLSGDARLDAAMRACGGYEALAMCQTDNIGFFERRFAEHYEHITDAELTRESLPQITGGLKLGGPWKLADIMKSLERDDERP